MIRTYSEMIQFDSFIDRFNYLKLDGAIGRDTFGFDRYLNQIFYKLPEWLEARDKVIIRDNGCDLGVEGREIYKGIIIHHMNVVTKEDIINHNPILFDPDFLVTTYLRTHNAIHYGDARNLVSEPIIRTKNDTIPWRR